MKPDATREQLLLRFATSGVTLQELTPAREVEELLAFYAKQRVDGCSLEEDSYMLLYEWGVFD